MGLWLGVRIPPGSYVARRPLNVCRYFKSKFHCLDATVIIAGFVLDVLLKGILEEIGSIVVVLRLWRVFKIIEELSAGAEEQMEPLQEHVEDLEKENHELRQQVAQLKVQQGAMV